MNRYSSILLGAFLGLTLTLSTTAKVSSEGVKKETKEAVANAAQSAKEQKDEFVGKAQKDMDELSAKMQKLKKRARVGSDEAKAKLDRQIESLRQEQRTAGKKLARLKSSTGEAWRDLRSEVEASIDRLRQSFERIKE